MALSQAEFIRQFSRRNVQDAVKRIVRNSKKRAKPAKPLSLVQEPVEPNSIKDLTGIGHKLICDRIQDEYRRNGAISTSHRIDFYYIDEISKWLMADALTKEGKCTVDHLSRYSSTPKPALEGGTIRVHFWLQFALPDEPVFSLTPEHGWKEMRTLPGVGVFDDTFRIGMSQDDEEFETDFEDFLDDNSIVSDGDPADPDYDFSDDSEDDGI